MICLAIWAVRSNGPKAADDCGMTVGLPMEQNGPFCCRLGNMFLVLLSFLACANTIGAMRDDGECTECLYMRASWIVMKSSLI